MEETCDLIERPNEVLERDTALYSILLYFTSMHTSSSTTRYLKQFCQASNAQKQMSHPETDIFIETEIYM